MDYTGLLTKFKVDRPLTAEERELRLKQNERLDVKPAYEVTVIRLNSTYLETVDKFYTWKGWLSTGMIAVGVMMATVLGLSVPDLLSKFTFVRFLDTTALNEAHLLMIVLLLGIPLFSVSVWALRLESFRYTHYPLRFNRKTRMVHAFRYDGTVLSAPWDDLFFTLGRGNRHNLKQEWDVRMHVLDADGVTVRDTLSLGLHSDDQDILRRYWELHRRYMEEGPQAISAIVEVFMPVDEKRETFLFGYQRWWSNFLPSPAAYVLMAPFVPLFALGRWFAMQTSKVPIWPAQVEAACAIEPDDLYRRDARDNPVDMFG